MKAEKGEEYEYDLKVVNPPIGEDGSVKQRTVEIFPTDPSLIYGPEEKKRNIVLLKETRKFEQPIPVYIRSNKIGLTRTKVNCVDINSKEIIQQFLVEVNTIRPIDSDNEPEFQMIAKEDHRKEVVGLIGREK